MEELLEELLSQKWIHAGAVCAASAVYTEDAVREIVAAVIENLNLEVVDMLSRME